MVETTVAEEDFMEQCKALVGGSWNPGECTREKGHDGMHDDSQPYKQTLYCPCGGECHHSSHPCGITCLAAELSHRAEA